MSNLSSVIFYAVLVMCGLTGAALAVCVFLLCVNQRKRQVLRRLSERVDEYVAVNVPFKGTPQERDTLVSALLHATIAHAQDAAVCGIGKAAALGVSSIGDPGRQFADYLEQLARLATSDPEVGAASFRTLVTAFAEKARGNGMRILASHPRISSLSEATPGLTFYYSNGSRIVFLFRLGAEQLPTAWLLLDEVTLSAVNETADAGSVGDDAVLEAVEATLNLARARS